MFWQTRAGKLLNNGAAGWLIASLLWAGLHWFIFSQGRTHFQTLVVCMALVALATPLRNTRTSSCQRFCCTRRSLCGWDAWDENS